MNKIDGNDDDKYNRMKRKKWLLMKRMNLMKIKIKMMKCKRIMKYNGNDGDNNDDGWICNKEIDDDVVVSSLFAESAANINNKIDDIVLNDKVLGILNYGMNNRLEDGYLDLYNWFVVVSFLSLLLF